MEHERNEPFRILEFLPPYVIILDIHVIHSS